ncbi:hypothetical protein L6472_06075 [Prevotella sp. E13-17]|uniref:hypothetical protein n=1 Tax=Prevotella sp. E13-17 TaxID=2913616 RepID=UPI001EDB7A1E|nr:hypothetical protein [Prevotella sp. E13-17]UKK52145.1 hypothetical protein L6472_06075 [Prevotella sp. E13-17]
MTEEKFISLGSDANGFGGRSNGWSPADFAAVMGNNRNGGIFGSNGMWDGVLGLFGLGIVSSMFGWNGNQNNNRGNCNCNDEAISAALANVVANSNGQQLLMQQITGVGNRVAELATAYGVSTDAVQAGLNNVSLAMANFAAQSNMSVAQLQMALQKGQSDIALQFCSCCKDQALAMCQQTNTLVTEGNRNTQRIVDSQNEGFRSILQQMYNDKLEAKNEKIAELTALALAKDGKISQIEQNQLLMGGMAQMQSALQSQIGGVKTEVDAIKRCQTPVLTVPDNRYQAVPTGIANIGSDFIGTLLVARLFGLIPGTGTGTDTGGGTTPTQSAR